MVAPLLSWSFFQVHLHGTAPDSSDANISPGVHYLSPVSELLINTKTLTAAYKTSFGLLWYEIKQRR